jgi:hypothetical protein
LVSIGLKGEDGGFPAAYPQGYSRDRDLGERRVPIVRRSTYLQIGGTAIILAFTLGACTPGTQATASPTAEGDVSIVGTWNCGPPDEPERDVYEISADGTVALPLAQGGPEGLTWSVEGDRVSFQGPPNERPDMATIESEDRIVFDDGGSQGDGFVCTRAS